MQRNQQGGLRTPRGLSVGLRVRCGVSMSLTFPSQVRGDAGLGPPPVGPGALILPAGREERSGGKGLRREMDKVEKDKRTGCSFVRGRVDGVEKDFQFRGGKKKQRGQSFYENVQGGG